MAKNVDAFSLLVLLACSTAPLVHASAPQIFQRDSLPEGFQKAQLQNPGQDVQKKHFRGSKMPQQQRAMEATEAGFRAYYIGSFRNYVSAACRAKVPISLRASCRGGKIDFLGHGYTSTFITCDRISPTDSEPGWDEIRCISGSAYTNDDEDSIDWTDILFTCTGPEVGDVEARFIYEDNGPGGSCFIGFFGSATDNFRMAQLGVYCNEDASFNYDPAFFECGANSWPNDPNGRYTCHYGENGRRRENIEWEDLTVESDVHRYRPDCIAVVDSFGNETIDMDLELPAAPDITPVPIGTYKARFRTHFYLRETDYSFTEMEGPSTITVQCTTLGSEISLSRKDDGFECLKVADDTLVCTTMDYGNVSPRDWNFGSFDYECESPQLPEVKATYEENAIKYGSPFASDVDYAFPYLAMAVYCDGDPAPHEHAPYHYDYFFRCPNNEGSTWDQYDIDSIPRCFGKGAFVNETGPDAPFFTIPSFSMYTDYRWSQHAFSTCYEFTTPVPSSEPSTSSEPSVSSVPSDIPTLSSQPSSSPSQRYDHSALESTPHNFLSSFTVHSANHVPNKVCIFFKRMTSCSVARVSN